MNYSIFDIETDGLYEDVTKIHCLSYRTYTKKHKLLSEGTLTDYQSITNWLKEQKILVGHKIISYDVPVLEQILGVKVGAKLIDTLILTYVLYPYRKKPGLDAWGKSIGIEKPQVLDWKNLDLETYMHRCEIDVEINAVIFHMFIKTLTSIYKDNLKDLKRYINYLMFKAKCLWEQEQEGITLDLELIIKTMTALEIPFKEKKEKLRSGMPKELGVILKKKPKNIYKKEIDWKALIDSKKPEEKYLKDGITVSKRYEKYLKFKEENFKFIANPPPKELTSHGHRWMNYLTVNDLPKDTEIVRDLPKPTSSPQLKKWLAGLGWKPETFKENDKGEKIPQVSLPSGQGLCPSVKALYDKEPLLKHLDGLYVIRHRIGVLKSFKNAINEGKVYSGELGLTNTLRLRHRKPFANLPGVDKAYAKDIRRCVTVPNKNYLMCGSDVSGLEDNTKQHYIFNYDPTYVKEMRVPGFCPHLDIAKLAGLVTQKEIDYYNWFKSKKEDYKFKPEEIAKFKVISANRKKIKPVNFGMTYGCGAAKVAKMLGENYREGKRIYDIYWKRNKAVKQTAADTIIQSVKMIRFKTEERIVDVETEIGIVEATKDVSVKYERNQKWAYNPVSRFWYLVKNEKDIFALLNSSTGVFFFDMWIYHIRKLLNPHGIRICLQYHDK